MSQPGLTVATLGPNDGLSFRWVLTFLEDSQGFMWIGTYEGLNRYDGSEFTIYKHNSGNPNSLPDNRIWAIDEAADGKIWVVTGKGLRIYDPHSHAFTIGTKGVDLIQYSPVPDRTIERRMLFYLPELAPFFKAEPKQSDSPTLKLVADLFSNSILNDINAVTKQGEDYFWLWLTDGNYLHFDIAKSVWVHHDIKNKILSNNSLPITEQGYFLFPGSEGTLDSFALPDGIAFNDWNFYQVDNKQNIWFRNIENKLFAYEVDEKKLKYYGTFKEECFYEDRAGIKWTGSEMGIKKITESRRLFENYLAIPFDLGETPPIGISARRMVEMPDGNIFLRHQETNVPFLMDPGRQSSQPFKLDIANYTDDMLIDEVAIDQEATLWFNLPSVGVASYDLSSNTGTIQPIAPGIHAGLILDNQLRIWKNIYDGDSSQIIIFDPVKNNYSPLKKFPGQLGEAYFDQTTDHLWIAFRQDLIKINTRTNQTEIIPLTIFQGSDVFGIGHIWAFHFWEDHLWLGSPEGLIQLDPDKNKIVRQFTQSDGLPHNKIYTIESAGENLWLGTHNGLCRFNPKTGEVKNFYVEDGLSHNEFNRYSSLTASDGRLWFGTVNGVNAFFSEDLENLMTAPPELIWTKFSTYQIKEDTTIVHLLNSAEKKIEFEITPNVQEFSLQFALLSLIYPTKNKYSWYIEGIEKEWSQNSHQPLAKYRNVEPGTYTFHAKAVDHEGNPAGNTLSATLLISPVWYLQWWAKTGGLIFLILGSYGFYRFRLQRKLEQQETLRLKETNELKTKLYTNITHEFRTPLTVILGMANQLKSDAGTPSPAEINNKLNLITRNGENLLDLVNQILDLSKLDSGSIQLNKINSDVVQFLNYLLDSFSTYAGTKSIQLHFLTNLNHLKMDFDPEKLKIILSNLLSNAIKFTPQNGHIYLQLSAQLNSDQIPTAALLQIKDTGIGIREKDLPFIFDRFYQVTGSSAHQAHSGGGTGIGLALVKELVRLMKGSIQVQSTLGKGTQFDIHFPITQIAEKSALAGIVSQAKKYPKIDRKLTSAVIDGESDLPVLLIVEDNEDVAYYIRSCLSPAGKSLYQILHADNGRTGIDLAIKHVPDVIISDVMMPDKSGYELVQTLKSDPHTSHIPIILLTAKADLSSKLEGLQKGADAYLTKPFNEKELIIRLRKLLELRRELQLKYSKEGQIEISDSNTHPARKTAPSLEDIFLQKIIKHVEENMADADFHTMHLCRKMGMSKTQLYRKLKALTNQSIALHIRSIRLRKAKEMLRTSKDSISEIAYQVGFNDPAYFSRTYAAEFGNSPSAERT